jgi:hypothetical protein
VWVPIVAALAGAIGGSVLTQVLLGRREDRRWRQEREHERLIWAREDAGRSYDHRRQAYMDFLAEFHRLRRVVEAARAQGATSEALPRQAMDDLTDLWTAVLIYGSEDGQQWASACHSSLRLWAWHPERADLEETVMEDWNQYLTQVRIDLGVPKGATADMPPADGH